MKIDLTSMITESRNPASADIDSLPTLDMLRVINREDQTVALAVEKHCRRWHRWWMRWHRHSAWADS